jgi:hypothetical protein
MIAVTGGTMTANGGITNAPSGTGFITIANGSTLSSNSGKRPSGMPA